MCFSGTGNTWDWVKAQAVPTFNHYDNGFKNIIDPTGSWGKGDKGQIIPLLGNTRAQDKKDAEEAKRLASANQPAPTVTYPSAEQQAADEVERKKKELALQQVKVVPTGASTLYNPQKIQ